MSITLNPKISKKHTQSPITQIRIISQETQILLTQSGILYILSNSSLTPFTTLQDNDKITTFDIIPSAKQNFLLLLLGTEQGTLYLINNSGNIQKTIKEAHKGSIIKIKFSKDYQTITTSGEDNSVKLWSKSGMLRSEIFKSDSPIYSFEWSSDSQNIVLSGSRVVTIKSIKPGNKDVVCKICDFGVALLTKWSRLEDIFFVASEDCRVSVFDCFGRGVSKSEAFEYPFSSGDWILGTDKFILFSIKEIVVFNRNAKVRSRVLMGEVGMTMALSENSNKFYIGLANGNLQTGYVNIFEEITYKNVNIDFQQRNQLVFSDIHSDYMEKVNLGNKEVLGVETFNDMIMILVQNQCFVYKIDNFVTPVVFEIKDEPLLFSKLTSNYILLAYQTQPSYICIYDFFGKLINTIKFSSQTLNKKLLELSYESLFVIDPANSKLIKILDPLNGKVSFKFTHQNEILEIQSNNINQANQRKILIFDSNKDLYIYFVIKNIVKKIASMVYSFKWHEKLDIFVYTSDQKLVTVYNPNSFILDQELYYQCLEKKSVLKNNFISYFNNTQIYLKNYQNSKTVFSINPLAVKLIEHFNNIKIPLESRISKAVKLARFLKNKLVWAILCVFCLENRDMTSAEICLGSLENLEKVQFVYKINNLDDEILSQAYLFQMLNKEKEAENLLLKENKILNVLKMNVRNFNFLRALEIAEKSGENLYVEYVVLHRKRYLGEIGIKEELLEEFKNLRCNKTLEELKNLLKN